MAINKDEARERQPARRSKKQTLAQALGSRMPPPPAGPYGSPPPRESYSNLWEFVAAGHFRSMVVVPDGRGGGTFTVKGVLELRAAPVGVYLHGAVDSLEMVETVVDDLLRKGHWRRDKYWKASARDR